MKQKMVLIASVIIGLVAFFLTGKYLENEKAKLYAGAEKIAVVAAAHELTSGTIISREDIKPKWAYKSSVRANICLAQDFEQMLGRRLIFGLGTDDPISWNDFENADGTGSGLASVIQSKMRAISISVSGPSAVSGLIQPNDHVDIIGTFTYPSRKKAGDTDAVTLTVLQDVTVLATGTRLAKSSLGSGWNQAAGSYGTVTLQVTPREAEVLVFAQHAKGQLLLTLRNKGDVTYVANLPEVDFQHIEEKLPELNLERQNSLHNQPL